MKMIIMFSFLLCGCSTVKSDLYQPHLASEGDFVMVGNPAFSKYVETNLTKDKLQELEIALFHSLEIPLTLQGFVQAANRSGKEAKDETNYDAVWVRDSIWVYFSFLESNQKEKAKKIICALWDYYSSPEQVGRFRNIISHPELADGMSVPHIRFNGKDPGYADVLKDGKPEVWNHRQNDAHGLFLLGVAIGHKQGLLNKNDFSLPRKQVLNLLVEYFKAIKFWNFPDAGAWEEISRVNTSSVAMVVKALENSEKLQSQKLVSWKARDVGLLKSEGYKRIKNNLNLGGESPDYPALAPEYRREDAALFNLFLPIPLKKLSSSEKLLALTILEKLIRPFGVIRYPLDSYQSGNYWLKEKSSQNVPDPTGDSSSTNAFKARFGNFIPGTEAQWFFDSKLAMIYLQFADTNAVYKNKASLHFKRALGQVTAASGQILAADGKPVQNLAFPESVNVEVKNGKRSYFPSPITPLNWAKASFHMSLIRLKNSFH